MRVLSLCTAIVAFLACSDLPPTPDEMQNQPKAIATWDTVEASTHTKASRPPEPVLIVDRREKTCFKVYSVFPQEYRLPNGQAYSLRDCEQDCGTSIQCPSWAREVYADLERRTKKQSNDTEETVATPDDTTVAEDNASNTPAPTKKVSAKTDSLGPPPTEAPEKTIRQ